MIKITDLRIGDIFLYKDKKYVYVHLDSREDSSSTAYERIYKVIPYEFFEKFGWDLGGDIEGKEFLKHFISIPLIGHDMIYVEEVEGIAPFKFEEILIIRINRKQKKLVETWV